MLRVVITDGTDETIFFFTLQAQKKHLLCHDFIPVLPVGIICSVVQDHTKRELEQSRVCTDKTEPLHVHRLQTVLLFF